MLRMRTTMSIIISTETNGNNDNVNHGDNWRQKNTSRDKPTPKINRNKEYCRKWQLLSRLIGAQGNTMSEKNQCLFCLITTEPKMGS